MTEEQRLYKINEIWRETNDYKKFVSSCDQCGELGRFGAPQWAEKCCEKHEGFKKYAGHVASFDRVSTKITIADITGTKANIQRNCDLERLVEDPESRQYFTIHTTDLAWIAFADEMGYCLNTNRDPEKFDRKYNKKLIARSKVINRELRRREREDEVGTHSLIFGIEPPKTIPALPAPEEIVA